MEKSGTSMMSLASPAEDSLLELSRPLSPLDEDGGDTLWLVTVLSPLYTVVTELSGMCTVVVSPPLVVDMSTRWFPLPLRFPQVQLPCHTCNA